MPIPLRPGETALLLGGLVPHEVTPVAAGQDRIVAIHCYQLGEAPGGRGDASDRSNVGGAAVAGA